MSNVLGENFSYRYPFFCHSKGKGKQYGLLSHCECEGLRWKDEICRHPHHLSYSPAYTVRAQKERVRESDFILTFQPREKKKEKFKFEKDAKSAF